MAYDSLLMCKKCHSSLVVPKRITVKKLTVYVWARCSHCTKEVKFTLPLPQVQEWVDPIAQNFFRCPKCGVTGVVTREIAGGDFTKIILYCPSCQKAFTKAATTSVFSYLMASHVNQLRPQPAMPTYFIPMPQSLGAPVVPTATVPPQVGTGQPARPAPARPTSPAPQVAPISPVALSPGARQCTNCGTELTVNASFCRKCGVPVDVDVDKAPRCPFCGATLSEKAKVCPKCSSEVRCKECDSFLHANARFCIKCGKPVEREGEEIEFPKVTCHFCGAPLELDEKICPECSKPTVCPSCGSHLKSGIRFCNKCGENVSAITMVPMARSEEEEGANEELDENLDDIESTVKCPNCKAEMNAIYKFCTICGSHLDE